MRSRWIWLAIVLIWLALLAVPDTRDVLRMEADSLLPSSPFHYIYSYLFSAGAVSEVTDDQLSYPSWRVMSRYLNDWRLALGSGLLTRYDRDQITFITEARRLAPKEPAVLSALALTHMKEMQLYRKEDWGYGRPVPEDFREELPSPGETKESREILKQWIAADPENAAPRLLLSWLNFGEKKDAEAMSDLRATLTLPRLDFYEIAEKQAAMQTLKAAGVPDFETSELAMVLSLNQHLAKLRELARLAVYKGMEAQAAGRNEEAVADWLSVIHFGRLLRYQETTAIEGLVGQAVEAIGAGPIYKWYRLDLAAKQELKPARPLTDKEGRYNRGDIFEGKQHDLFLKYAGPGVTADVLAGLEQAQELKKSLMETGFPEEEASSSLIFWVSYLMTQGAVMLAETAVIALLALLLWIINWPLLNSQVRLRWPWAFVLAFLALLPIWGYWIFWGMKGFILLEQPKSIIDPAQLATISIGIIFFIPILILVCIVLASLWTWLKGKGAFSYGTIFARAGYQVALSGLLLLSVGSAVLAVRTVIPRAEATKRTEARISRGELADFRQEHPELSAPPKVAEIKPNR